jgi:hypothetical protein
MTLYVVLAYRCYAAVAGASRIFITIQAAERKCAGIKHPSNHAIEIGSGVSAKHTLYLSQEGWTYRGVWGFASRVIRMI